mmetsp:Transcript_9845/g.24568  ORF Transcript_9845/g.24568 Transcript_9845/m.24568 type:complete len:270 (+) Transcript_9845:735-1544(+)
MAEPGGLMRPRAPACRPSPDTPPLTLQLDSAATRRQSPRRAKGGAQRSRPAALYTRLMSRPNSLVRIQSDATRHWFLKLNCEYVSKLFHTRPAVKPVKGPRLGTSNTALSPPTYAALPLWKYLNSPWPSATLVVSLSPVTWLRLKKSARKSPCCLATCAVAGSARSPESIDLRISLNWSRLTVDVSLSSDSGVATTLATSPPQRLVPVLASRNSACSLRCEYSELALMSTSRSSLSVSLSSPSTSASLNSSSARSSALGWSMVAASPMA